MRLIIIYFIFAFFVSCKQTGNKNFLLGSWTTDYDKTKYPNNNILDKLTFYENDSLAIEYYLNGKLHESFSGRYSLDERKMILTTEYDTAKFQFEVMNLTKERLTATFPSCNLS